MSRPLLQEMFKPSSFTRDPRFAHLNGGPPPVKRADPVGEAFDRGYAQGVADARQQANEEEAEREAARGRIERAFAHLDEQATTDLRDRLRQTVLALCDHAVAPLAIDPDGLAKRVDRAVSMLQRSQDERRVLLNPEDLALVKDRLPAELTVNADPSIERGALRIETPDGGVEDGPSQWRRILAEAFREC